MWLFILLLMTGLAQADVYVVTNPQNGVYSISPQNDAVVPSGYTVTVLKGQSVQNLPITGSPQLYNFSNGGFTLNTTAVQAQQAAAAAVIAAQTAQAQTATSALAKIVTMLAQYDAMIANIKISNANMKFGICITIPSGNQDAFGGSYGSGQTSWRYKVNNRLRREKLFSDLLDHDFHSRTADKESG